VTKKDFRRPVVPDDCAMVQGASPPAAVASWDRSAGWAAPASQAGSGRTSVQPGGGSGRQATRAPTRNRSSVSSCSAAGSPAGSGNCTAPMRARASITASCIAVGEGSATPTRVPAVQPAAVNAAAACRTACRRVA
jgi:hypothetical protein